jgi:C1A family cysteine protease
MLSCSGLGTCQGAETLDGKFLQTTGLPPDSDYRYIQADGKCSAAASGWQSRANKIMAWSSIPQNVESVKAALVKYGPLATGYLVFEDFMYYSSGIYKHTTGSQQGGHAVIIVGYNDAEKYFIVKNSWGPSWGENGYFRIAYSEMTSDTSFGMITVAYQDTASKSGAEMSAPVSKSFDANTTWQRMADNASGSLNQLAAF